MNMSIAKNQTAENVPPQKVAKLINYIIQEYPIHKNHLEMALPQLTKEDLEMLETYLEYCMSQDKDIDYLGEAYLTVVEDTLREQIYFQKHKAYRHSSYQEVANDVYHNDDYMDKYMYGLAITGFLWPNHLEMYRFFQRSLPKDKGGRYLEIGPGHGFYLMRAMQLTDFDQFNGIDISQASTNQTRKIVSHYCPKHLEKMSFQVVDFLEAEVPSQKLDAIVMGEVLEHVENPDSFLERIYDFAKKDAFIFVTTCINAPAIDHIYLYKTLEDVEVPFKNAGLDIVDSLYLPYEGKTVKECIESDLPINVAYVLKKI